MTKDVQINIKSDNSEIGSTIGDLKRMADRTFKEIRKSADDQSKEVTRAFQRMGIRTEEAIRKSTREAKENYRKIRDSGTASANDIKRAHDVMTRKIQRNNEELVRGTKGFGESLTRLGGPVKKLTTAAGLLGAAAAAVGVAFGIKAFKESVKFENAVVDLQKVLGDGEGKASDFADQATELSEKYGIAATDVLAGATEFKQAGFTIKEAFQLQDAAIKQSIAGGISVEESSERIKNSLRGFGVGASEATRLVDVLNEVSNQFGANTRELATGVADLSPIAAKAGLSIEETAGFLTPIIEVFGSGSEAANALKTGFLALVDPTAEATKKFEELGIAITKQNGEQKTAKELALELAGSFGRLTDTQQLQATAAIFGKNQAGRLQTAFANLGRVSEVTEVALNSAGSATEEVEKKLTSADVQIKISTEKFNNMARVIGDDFKDELVGVISQLGDMAAKFKKVVAGGGLDPLFKVLNPQLAKIQEVFEDVSNDLPGFVTSVAERVESIIILINGAIKVFNAVKLGFLGTAQLILRFGQTLAFVTDKLGITELAYETFTIAMENNQKAMDKTQDKLLGTTEETEKLTKTTDDHIDTLAEMEAELKRNNEAIEANNKKKQEQIDQINRATEALKGETQAKAENTAAFKEVAESAKREGSEDFVGPLQDLSRTGKSPGTQGRDTSTSRLLSAGEEDIEERRASSGGAGGGVSVSTGFKLPQLREFLSLPQSKKELLARSRGISVDELLKMIRLRMKEGGIIDASSGQLIPGGYGGGDKVPLLGEPGEGMIKKEAVRAMGTDAIHRINNLDFSGLLNNLFRKDAQRLQEGGIVTGSGEGETVNVNLLMGEKSHPMKSSKGVAAELLETIRTVNIVNGRAKRVY